MKVYKFLYPAVFFLFFLLMSSCHRKTIPASSGNEGKTYKNNEHIDLKNMENDILLYVNEHRRAVGLHNLQMLNIASDEAAKHSADMAARRVAFGHAGFESRVSTISRSLGSVSAAAENVADGKLTARQVVDGWLHSPGHKKKYGRQLFFNGHRYCHRCRRGNLFHTDFCAEVIVSIAPISLKY